MWPKFRPTYARKRIDISWSDIRTFLCNFILHPLTTEQSEAALDELWCPEQTLVTYTVRSAFDLYLQVCQFPPESQIIISAVTVPDMARIIRMHNFVPVAVEIQEDGSVLAEDVEALIGVRTKAIVIAHLFGNRMQLDGIAAIARLRGLKLIEDCAEAFCGRVFTGYSGAEISMFSFGTIKTSTAFGGALSTVRDPKLLASLKKLQTSYYQQSNASFLTKMLKNCFFKFLTDGPYIYGAFLAVLEMLGIDHHLLIRSWSRSFHPGDILTQIRKGPSDSGLLLLHQRISSFQSGDLQKRKMRIEDFGLRSPIRAVGFGQAYHHYWLYPLRVSRPADLIKRLYQEGFDAADGGTSLAVIDSRPKSEDLMKSVVYLPMDHAYDRDMLLKLVSIINIHEDSLKKSA